jgi:hypothetical protein
VALAQAAEADDADFRVRGGHRSASQFHDALLAPRRRRGLGELQRLHAVVDARS